MRFKKLYAVINYDEKDKAKNKGHIVALTSNKEEATHLKKLLNTTEYEGWYQVLEFDDILRKRYHKYRACKFDFHDWIFLKEISVDFECELNQVTEEEKKDSKQYTVYIQTNKGRVEARKTAEKLFKKYDEEVRKKKNEKA